ncbi:MAG: aspartate-semialdehyde dehydrogenase, partial [Thermoproteota archaeon]|nr:aspartate-semialdehyde dehydrogenase [Thermoproteota archaeon]
MDKLKTVIIGATGVVGQQFVIALQNHPWFEIVHLAASERSTGKVYRDALRDERTKAFRWFCDETPGDHVLDLKVEDAGKIDVSESDIVFSAVEADVAQELEPRFAKTTPVISTARAFRYEEDVPILVPGVNSEQAEIINIQKRRRGWKGFISPQPNCTTTGLAITLKPLCDSFGVESVIM